MHEDSFFVEQKRTMQSLTSLHLLRYTRVQIVDGHQRIICNDNLIDTDILAAVQLYHEVQ